MKKHIVFFLVVLLSTVMSSCSWRENGKKVDNDRKIANQQLDNVVEAIRQQDTDALTVLFSGTALKKASGFGEAATELFGYFEGELVSYDDWAGPYVSTEREWNYVLQIMESTYDVKTTECDYRIAIRYVAQDTSNKQNVGIESLYIIRSDKDEDLSLAYYGDGKFTPGINIGIPNCK